jgi:hypothetical protein
MKSKPKKEPMTPKTPPLRVYITYQTQRKGGQVVDRDDPWSRKEPEHIDLRVMGVHKGQPSSFFCDSLEVSPEVFQAPYVYLVVVRFYDGGTFGVTHGLHEFQDIFKTPEEAWALREKLLGEVTGQEKAPPLRRAWVGHFAGLESVDVLCFPLTE